MGALVRCLLLLVLAAPLAPAPQKQEPGDSDEALRIWVSEHRDAVLAYRSGEREAALRVMAGRTIAEQRRIVSRILTLLEAARTSPGGGTGGGAATRSAEADKTTSLRPTAFSWRMADLPTAGALHMDAAFEASRRPDEVSAAEAASQINLAETLLGYAAQFGGDGSIAPRWELAIGLTALADGRFRTAASSLDASCATFKDFPPLQLACGSIHETLAMLPGGGRILPAPQAKSASPPFGLGPSLLSAEPTGNGLPRAKAARDDHLKEAVRGFQRATAGAPDEPEAQMRLAHVLILQGDDRAAVPRLEALVGRTDLDTRLAYLSRLFLGGTLVRLGQLDRARVLFEEAIARVPSGQSAHVALAAAVRASGDHEQASALLHRMMNAPKKPDDPWIGYHFGQYWIPDALIGTLRREAQR